MRRWLLPLLLAGITVWIGMYLWRFHAARSIFAVRGEFVTVQDQKLYTATWGEGPPLLFLHGFPYHGEAALLVAEPLSKRRRFIALDLPGMGLSDKRLPARFTPEDLALSVKLFLDRQEIGQVDLLGHDLGGGVALVLAASYPRLVRRMVLLAPDCSAGGAGDELQWWWRWPVAGEAWASLALDRNFIRRLLRRSWAEGSEGWRHYVERYTHPLDTRGGRTAFLSLHRGRAGFSYLPYEERLKTPVLILWGERDRIQPPIHGRYLADGLAQAELRVLPDRGHLLLEEAPETVAEAVQAFLEAPEP